MMLIVTILIVFAILVLSELWWRWKHPHDEISRKFIHITVGSFAAFWPYFLSRSQIVLLSAAFVVVVGLSLYFNIFKAIHTVERPTWGEFCFAFAVGILALLPTTNLIYTISLLQMSLADGIAAIVGTTLGKKNSYRLLGHTKSLAGSAAFFVISLSLLMIYAVLMAEPMRTIVVVGLALLATGLENIAVRGLDNVVIPVVIASVLLLVS